MTLSLSQLAWVSDINKRNTSDELVRSVPEASDLLEAHKERKVKNILCTEAYKYCMRIVHTERDGGKGRELQKDKKNWRGDLNNLVQHNTCPFLYVCVLDADSSGALCVCRSHLTFTDP